MWAVSFTVGVAATILAASSAALFLAAQTWTTRAIAASVFGVALVVAMAYLAWHRAAQRRLWAALAVTTILASLLLLGAIANSTPSGVAPEGSPVQHRFTTQTTFNRFSITNVIPEIDQVKLGFLLMPFVDPILTRDQAARVSDFTLELYCAMERDPDFHELGSAMGFAYAGLLGRPDTAGHYYVYVPYNHGKEPLPALVFLHGSAGNFKAYTWLWSKLAEEQGMAIIAPSFGFGNWLRPGGVDAVLAAIEDAATVVEIDREHVFLAGLSNGGLGVSQLAVAAPDRFAGLIFLSPVMDTSVLQSQAFREQWAGRPVLVLAGEADRRIPLPYVQRHVDLLRQAGVKVSDVVYRGEDHFLVFSQPDAIRHAVAAWLRQNAPVR